MIDQEPPLANEFSLIYNKINTLRHSINSLVIGQKNVVDQVLIALFSNGHVLIEGVPGLGKTLLVRALAASFSGRFKRIQFTPDLMPADITGHAMYDMKEGKFRIRRGPVFTNLLLTDEINRSPAKTQAALLEVMQERQVSIEGKGIPLPKPFMVLATQNPIEQEGTYPLPEAELDRFLLKVFIDFPSFEDEINLSRQVALGEIENRLESSSHSPIFTASDITNIQSMIINIEIDEQIIDYAVRLVRATRENTSLTKGAGPRASIALIQCAKANALLRGESFVLPDDVKEMSLPVMRHRIILTAEMDIDGQKPDDVLKRILNSVEAPRL